MTDIVVFDLETTGVDTEVDRIVQFAALKLDEDFEELDRMVHVLNPGIPIEEGATKVHGFSNEDVADKPSFADVAPEIILFIGDCDLAGHNIISFDVPILMREFERHTEVKMTLDGRRLLDSLCLFRHFVPHTLAGALQYYYHGEEMENAHDALYDSLTSARVLQAQLFQYKLERDNAHELSMGDRVTLDGKLTRNEDGEIVLNFSKHKGTTLKDMAKAERGFLSWMLKNNFSEETKSWVAKAVRGELP